jgi:chromate transport protein ChrA
MIYLELFLTFLKIGAVSFGGGYGMISLIRDDCLSNGWLSDGELLNFIAVSESTPGPIAVPTGAATPSSPFQSDKAKSSLLHFRLPTSVL